MPSFEVAITLPFSIAEKVKPVALVGETFISTKAKSFPSWLNVRSPMVFAVPTTLPSSTAEHIKPVGELLDLLHSTNAK